MVTFYLISLASISLSLAMIFCSFFKIWLHHGTWSNYALYIWFFFSFLFRKQFENIRSYFLNASDVNFQTKLLIKKMENHFWHLSWDISKFTITNLKPNLFMGITTFNCLYWKNNKSSLICRNLNPLKTYQLW